MRSRSNLANRLYDWLAAADPCLESDVIFVLAGRECRKHFALGLFQEGWAPTLLLSVGRFEIRRFSQLELPTWLDLPAIASTTEPARRHYFVEFRSGTAAVRRVALSRFGTLREVAALSDWLRENTSVRSVTVVSSGYHLKRVRLCCRRLMPEGTKLTFVAVSEESRYLRMHWWRNPQSRKLILSEVLKIAIYKLLCLGVTKKVRTTIGLLQGRLSADCVSAEGS